MIVEKEYIKLIFGLKMKQIRTEKNLSLFGLAKLTGLSKSYLNEIEKGKKYPKTDKIVLLAQHLEVSYDHLVSLKLDKNLAPIGEILQSGILKEIPLDLFGIEEGDLIDIIANAPAKVNAFISTIIEIAQHYNVSRESFFLAALRSYQEAQNNYFEDLEEKVIQFSKAYQIDLESKIESEELREILVEEYGYTINENELSQQQELGTLRSVYIPKTKTLLISKATDEAQKAFIFAKEIAYNYLSIKERLYTFSWIKFENFDQVLNNFYASYFAGALIIPRKQLVTKLNSFLAEKKYDASHFVKMIGHFNASPESFYQRLTNILPKDFLLKNLFFLRLTHKKGSTKYQLKKELHITHQQEPRANEFNEHYCRRWVAIHTINEIVKQPKEHTFETQISHYANSNNEYIIFSSATPDPFNKEYLRSISVGVLITPVLKNKFKFIEDPSIIRRVVGVTCETCAVENCVERVVPAVQLERKQRNLKTEMLVENLMEKFGV